LFNIHPWKINIWYYAQIISTISLTADIQWNNSPILYGKSHKIVYIILEGVNSTFSPYGIEKKRETKNVFKGKT
jgi:hypothetical protein